MRAHLTTGTAAQVCVALHMLEKASAPDLIDTLVSNATHASPDVRRYALERLAALRPAAVRNLRADISRDPNAVGAARRREERARRRDGAVSPRSGSDRARRGRDGAVRPRARAAARQAAIAAGGGARGERARRANRVLAARLAGDHGLAEVVRELLADESFAVRRAALVAAGASDAADFTGMLVAQLVDRTSRRPRRTGSRGAGRPRSRCSRRSFTPGRAA